MLDALFFLFVHEYTVLNLFRSCIEHFCCLQESSFSFDNHLAYDTLCYSHKIRVAYYILR